MSRLLIAVVTLGAYILPLSLFNLAPVARAQEAEEPWKDLVAQGQYAAVANDYAKAEQFFLKAVHEAERFGMEDARVGVTLESLGKVYTAEKKFSDAESVLRRALGILEKADGDDSAQAAHVTLDIANNIVDSGHPDEALVWIHKTLSTYIREFGGTDVRTAEVLCLLGDSLRAIRNFAEAEDPLKRCADIRETDGGIDTVELASALHSLALTYVGEGKYALAEPRFKLAEKIRESKLGLTSPLLASTMEDHAALLKAMGREKEAERLMVLAAAIRRNEKKKPR